MNELLEYSWINVLLYFVIQLSTFYMVNMRLYLLTVHGVLLKVIIYLLRFCLFFSVILYLLYHFIGGFLNTLNKNKMYPFLRLLLFLKRFCGYINHGTILELMNIRKRRG